MVALTQSDWQAHNDNLAWVRSHRDTLREHGFSPPTSLARLGSWLDRHKGAVTKALPDEGGED